MDSEKLINSFETKGRIGHLVIYATIIFLGNLLIVLYIFLSYII